MLNLCCYVVVLKKHLPNKTFFAILGPLQQTYVKAEFMEFFWQKRVIFTPAKTTIAANQLHLLGIKQQRDAG